MGGSEELLNLTLYMMQTVLLAKTTKKYGDSRLAGSTQRKGRIGELLVRADLLKQGWDVFLPDVDSGHGLDLLAMRGRHLIRTIQVKAHLYKRNVSSVEVKVYPTPADYIAVPLVVDDKHVVVYFPHFGKSQTKPTGISFCISVNPTRNNQKQHINLYSDYLELPQ